MLSTTDKHMEDMMAASILLQDCFTKEKDALCVSQELRNIKDLFTQGHIFGWAVTDTLCQRVLGTLISESHTGTSRPPGPNCCFFYTDASFIVDFLISMLTPGYALPIHRSLCETHSSMITWYIL